ncbi:ImuA family protein [Oricola sp.]|uniref:ImuA family protein n=1 Tax=Oricola sp. TaxID=1979950 RepID=UPI003BA9A47F
MASAHRATARATLSSLRRQIAAIEGLPPALAEGGTGWTGPTDAAADAVLATGVEDFDRVIGGGVAVAALAEIHVREARDAGLAAGFAANLLSLGGAPAFLARDPVLWIGGPGVFAEAGLPHGRGLAALGFTPERLLMVEARRLADALWIAEEAACTRGLAATVVDLRGHGAALGLRETQRLNRRARAAARPVLLLRQSAGPEPTAAPLRLVLEPSPSAPSIVLAGTPHARAVPGGIGPPGVRVTIDKNKAGPAGRTFPMHWNADERHFYFEHAATGPAHRDAGQSSGAGGQLLAFPAAHSGAALPVSGDRPHRARALGAELAAEPRRRG